MQVIIPLLLCVAQIIAVFWLAQELLSLRIPWHIIIGGSSTSPSTSSDPTHSFTATPNLDITDSDVSPHQRYDRVVVMMVDALRQDMINERNEMEHVRAQLINGGSKCAQGFIAHAQSPTVTMPRITALMTGGIPQFIDILNNLDASALEGDNLIQRFQNAKKRMVLYGDDVWLKLFPNSFMRADGTSGFFTKDYTEVDDNVTRHIVEDLDVNLEHSKSTDWDVLILHYLGLDHVGHQHGPDAPQMHTKLKEMDDVFARVHNALIQQETIRQQQAKLDRRAILPTLLILMSDHGMNQAGNHGGASLSESSAVLGFFHVQVDDRTGSHICTPQHVRPDQHRQHQKIQARTVGQVDLAPTLGLMMGVGVPINSVGRALRSTFLLGASNDESDNDNDIISTESAGLVDPWNKYIEAQWVVAQQLTALLASKTVGTRTADPVSISEEVGEAYVKAKAASFPSSSSSSSSSFSPSSIDTNEVGAPLDRVQDIDAYIDLVQEKLLALLVSGGNGKGAAGRLVIGLAVIVFTIAVASSKLRRAVHNMSKDKTPGIKGWVSFTSAIHMPEATVVVPGLVLHLLTLTSSSAIENEHVVWFHVATLWVSVRILRSVYLNLKARAETHKQQQQRWDESGWWFLSLLLLRVLRCRLQVINFARLNHLEIPPERAFEDTALLDLPNFFTNLYVMDVALMSLAVSRIHYTICVFSSVQRAQVASGRKSGRKCNGYINPQRLVPMFSKFVIVLQTCVVVISLCVLVFLKHGGIESLSAEDPNAHIYFNARCAQCVYVAVVVLVGLARVFGGGLQPCSSNSGGEQKHEYINITNKTRWDQDALPLLFLLIHRPSNTTIVVIVIWFFRALGNGVILALSRRSPIHHSSTNNNESRLHISKNNIRAGIPTLTHTAGDSRNIVGKEPNYFDGNKSTSDDNGSISGCNDHTCQCNGTKRYSNDSICHCNGFFNSSRTRMQAREYSGMVGISLALWTVGQAVFFSTGNSHTMSTVDISGAYTGLLEYNQWVVGGLTGIITFSGPILAADQIIRVLCVLVDNTSEAAFTLRGADYETSHASATNCVGVGDVGTIGTMGTVDDAGDATTSVAIGASVCEGTGGDGYDTAVAVAWALFVYRSFRLLVASVVLVLMRSHLFVWSVFAPKWAYEVLQHLTAVICCVALVLGPFSIGRK